MIDRKAQQTVLRIAEQFPVVGITGPRQSGKTTLAQLTFPNKRYVTFDDDNMLNLAKSNPKDFVDAFPDGVIIDEAQKVPEIFNALKLKVDFEKSCAGKYILTGSSQFELKKNMTDSLSGRAYFVELLPFSIDEILSKESYIESPYDIIFKGQYPPLYDNDRNFILDDWFEGYLDTYVARDVKGLVSPSNSSTFKKFIQICALHSGQILSMDSISRDIGVSAPTVKNWLSILERSYIIHFLEPDSSNLHRALIKSPKLYFIDSGLLCYLLRIKSKEELLLSEMKGAIVESFAISEMLKNRTNIGKKGNLTYFRDKVGLEIDAIADWDHTFIFEIKSTSQTSPKISRNIKKYLELKNDNKTKPAIFYLGDHSLKINNIDHVSWKDWDKYSVE